MSLGIMTMPIFNIGNEGYIWRTQMDQHQKMDENNYSKGKNLEIYNNPET